MIDLKKLRELASKATKVVGWYPHSYSPTRPAESYAHQVRGPFFRWFLLQEGDDQSSLFPGNAGSLAPPEDDVNYCAAAMNSVPALLDEIERLQAENLTLRGAAAFTHEVVAVLENDPNIDDITQFTNDFYELKAELDK